MKSVNFCENGVDHSMIDGEREKILDNFFNIRYSLLMNMLEREQWFIPYKKCLTALQYYKEHGCLYMDFNRQSGSSYFLHWFLNWCTDNNYRSISLFYNMNNLKIFTDSHISIKSKTKDKIDNHILGSYQNKNSLTKYRGYSDIDFIVLDVSSIYKTHQIDVLMKEMCEYNPKLFIFL